jgi:hypothetical protein
MPRGGALPFCVKEKYVNTVPMINNHGTESRNTTGHSFCIMSSKRPAFVTLSFGRVSREYKLYSIAVTLKKLFVAGTFSDVIRSRNIEKPTIQMAL